MIYEQRHMELDGVKVISHFTFTPPLVASSNLHDQGCFIFPIHTEGKIYRRDGKKEVRSDQGALLKCGTYVNKWEHIKVGQPSEVVILRFFPEVIRENLDPKTISRIRAVSRTPKTTAVVQLDLLMKKYLESLFFYFDNPSLVTDEIVHLKLTELILLLVGNQEPNEASDLLLGLFDEQKFSVKQTVEANLFENLSLEELASLCDMGVSTFKRTFKKDFGVSPGRYIRSRRLEASAALLRDASLSVSEVAYQTGFSDPNYFSKSFHVKYGRSPSDYRDNEKNRGT